MDAIDKAIAEVKAVREHDEAMLAKAKMNEDTMEQMRERHNQEIEDFQNNCLHTFISEWTPYMWAPGHYENDVRICVRCEKVVETRT